VHAHGVDVGAVELALVGRGVVAPDLVDQLVLAEQLAFGAAAGLRRADRFGDG